MSEEKRQKKELSSYHNLPSAFDHFDDILQVTRDYSTMLCLDYDGTLTPIVENPEDAVITDEMRQQVKELAKKIPIAIVSGRDLAFVKKHVQLDEVYYAGSHGFEIRGPEDFHHEKDEAREALPLIDEMEKKLEKAFSDIEGVGLERKKYGIAIHYRKVDGEKVPEVKRIIDDVLDETDRLIKGKGKMVIELKPNVEWDKGRAVAYISKHLTEDGPEGAAIYIGDDITDEDAFHEIHNGVGILVGSHDEDSAADYRLENVDEVKDFLQRLTENL